LWRTHFLQLKGVLEAANKVDPKDVEDLDDWQDELEMLQTLRPLQALRDQMRVKEIPELDEQIKKHEESLPRLSSDAEQVTCSALNSLCP
jgi:DNA repair protein RAD50